MRSVKQRGPAQQISARDVANAGRKPNSLSWSAESVTTGVSEGPVKVEYAEVCSMQTLLICNAELALKGT